MATDKYLALLEQEKDQIAAYLPSYLRTDDERDRFFANARAVASNYLLKDCSPQSLLNCVIDAAKRGLMVGGPEKHCAVVPFDTKNGGTAAVLIVQWQGKSFLWQRAGAITKLKAKVVYEGDEFALIEGDEDRIEHHPDYKTERSAAWLNDINNIVGAYAIAWLPNGEKLHTFVSRSALKRTMEAVKKKNNGKLGFGWNDWLPEMCAKTAIHRLDGLIQPQPKMNKEQKEAWQITETLAVRDEEEAGDKPDDLPKATDGTEAPTPRRPRGGVEIVPDKPKEDRIVTSAEENDAYDSWDACAGTTRLLKVFLPEAFQVDDFAKLTLSQYVALKFNDCAMIKTWLEAHGG